MANPPRMAEALLSSECDGRAFRRGPSAERPADDDHKRERQYSDDTECYQRS